VKTFFLKKGPFDINFLLKYTQFTKLKKFKKYKVKNISNLIDANIGDITFLDKSKYDQEAKNTKASYCLLKESDIKKLNLNTIPILSSNPLLDFILVANLFYPESAEDNYEFKQNIKYKKFLKHNIFVDNTVKIGKNFKIGLNSVLKKNIIIGNNVKIGSNCVISNSIIEDNVTINDGSVLGKIGYGFKYINGKNIFIPHIGCVKILKGAYIGSNCVIDRGSFSNTVIGENTIIDNLVHVAHNVKIGNSCFITAQVGIAGSTNIGQRCIIGGQSGISGHLNIGNNVQIGGHSGVIKNVNDNSKIMGYPAINIKEFVRRSLKK